MSFAPVKINAQKLNPAKTAIDFQWFIRLPPCENHDVVIINSVELNILLGEEGMSEKKSPTVRSFSALLLFPEIIGVAAAAFATPALLWKLFAAGQTAWAIGGLVCWGIALYFATRMIFRRQYALAFVPMLAILGLCLLLLRVVSA